MINLSILLTCHNRQDKTLSCLQNLYRQHGLGNIFQLSTFLVDDASTDGTADAVKLLFPQVNIIDGDGTLYWNRGMYKAWEAASKQTFDAYIWLNDDTNLYDDAIETLINAMEETRSQAIICGTIESPTQPGEVSYGGSTYANQIFKMNQPSGALAKCDTINGNCVLVPHAVFTVVGNLDWTFRHAIGDHDYSLRAQKAGFESYTTGSFIGTCPRNATLPKWCLPEIRFTERVRNLYSPLGNSHPLHYFKYENRHFGLIIAVKHFVTIHLRVLIPSLWRR
ncbi:MAG: glycosyltransferase family 2 protein [Bacteroidales bacterium]|nr:glycosyltransferase family 2 protein [Bacteroidales bacterium]